MRDVRELSATEAKVFRSWWQDGVLDLIAGSCVTLIGLGWLAGFPLAGIAVPPIALTAWPILRRRITEPRLGQVRFAARRRRDMRFGMIAVLSLGLVLGGFVADLYRGGSDSQLLRWLAPAIPGSIVAALALSTAEALRLVRFVGYAAGFVAAALVVAALDADPGWALFAGGALVAASGARLLVRFLREFPVLSTEMDG